MTMCSPAADASGSATKIITIISSSVSSTAPVMALGRNLRAKTSAKVSTIIANSATATHGAQQRQQRLHGSRSWHL
jgi:hypothetical protein